MFKQIAAAVALVAASSAAVAQPFFQQQGAPSLYAGVAGTSTKIDQMDRDSGYGAFIGYKFNDSIAIEGGYYRVSDDSYRLSGVAVAGVPSNTRVDLTLDQIDISVIGTLPLSNGFDVYGRLGYARLNAEAEIGDFTGKDHDSNALFGLGLGYTFSPVVHGRLEVQRPASDTTKIVAGVAFKF